MSKGNTFENDILGLIFNATPIANLADNATASALTNLFVSLHTADPGEAGTQTTSECTYGSYGRATVARTTGGWTAPSGGSVSPAANIDFAAATSGSETATYAAVGVAISGASKILYSGALTPNIVISSGVTPRLTTSSTITED